MMSKVIEAAESRGTVVALELALEGALALVKSLKLQNDNLRAANEAKHREICLPFLKNQLFLDIYRELLHAE